MVIKEGKKKLLETIDGLLTDILETSCLNRSINLHASYAKRDEVMRFVHEKGYRLSCVCGSEEGWVKPIAVKFSKIDNVEVINVIYGEEMTFSDYEKLKLK